MNSSASDRATAEKRQTRGIHVLVGLASFGIPLLLIGLARLLFDRDRSVQIVGFVCCWSLFYAFREQVYHLGDLLENWLGRRSRELSRESASVKPPVGENWYAIVVNGSVCLSVSVIVVIAARGFPSASVNAKVEQVRAQTWLRSRQATSAYWQSAVANLHALRFGIPSGQEPAEKYYERMFQQLKLQTDAAKSASTIGADPELVQLVTRHLSVDDQVLQLKHKLDEFMQQQQLPAPTDTADQRMAMTQLLLGILQLNPEALEKMPHGPERDLLEKGLELEQLQQEQFREIEIMQAVLQERHKGVKFPLPAINR